MIETITNTWHILNDICFLYFLLNLCGIVFNIYSEHNHRKRYNAKQRHSVTRAPSTFVCWRYYLDLINFPSILFPFFVVNCWPALVASFFAVIILWRAAKFKSNRTKSVQWMSNMKVFVWMNHKNNEKSIKRRAREK